VVLPVRNEENFIAETIGYIQKQDYPRDKLEIIVADGDSEDHTTEIVEKLKQDDDRIFIINNPGRLSSAGRNIGVKNATGEIVIFIDGHTYIDNDQLLQNTARLMKEKKVSILSRPQFLETPHNTFFQKAVALARRSIIGHGLDSTIYTEAEKIVDPSSSGASYRKEVFTKIGLYDERFDACEDVELNHRAAKSGYDAFASPRLAVYYYPRKSLWGLFRQLARYGTGRFRLARKHPGTLSIGTLIPFLFTVGMPILLILALIFQPVWYPFAALAALYLAVVLLSSMVLAVRHNFGYIIVLPFIYLAIHTGLGYGFARELLKTIIGRGIGFGKGAPDD
jgi:glycosyltransferase involved in cell wall biosynthesis